MIAVNVALEESMLFDATICKLLVILFEPGDFLALG